MLRRKILPAEEELWDTVMLVTFAAVWYGLLIRAVLNQTTSGINLAIFMIGGILPLYIAFVKGRNALSCRKKRREAVGRGRCCRGIVRRVVVESIPYTGRHGHIHYQKRYYMIIERLEEGLNVGTEIKTSAYSIPVHLYLKSREVKLYSDASGWKWYVEELQCGRFRQQQSVALETDGLDEERYAGQMVFRMVWIIMLLLIFLQGIIK